MRVIVLFDPDDECVDPLDPAKTPRPHYDEIGRATDAIVIWREYGDQFEDGVRTHLLGQGIWQHVTVKQFKKALRKLGALH